MTERRIGVDGLIHWGGLFKSQFVGAHQIEEELSLTTTRLGSREFTIGVGTRCTMSRIRRSSDCLAVALIMLSAHQQKSTPPTYSSLLSQNAYHNADTPPCSNTSFHTDEYHKSLGNSSTLQNLYIPSCYTYDNTRLETFVGRLVSAPVNLEYLFLGIRRISLGFHLWRFWPR